MTNIFHMWILCNLNAETACLKLVFLKHSAFVYVLEINFCQNFFKQIILLYRE